LSLDGDRLLVGPADQYGPVTHLRAGGLIDLEGAEQGTGEASAT
jgi:hypothetical protein